MILLFNLIMDTRNNSIKILNKLVFNYTQLKTN